MSANNTIATVFNVFDSALLEDRVFMYGWRKWSFDMTRKGDAATAHLQWCDNDLLQKIKSLGKTEMDKEKPEWNSFRSTFLNLLPTSAGSYHDRYRQNFKHIGLVVLDCCFIVKYKYNKKGLYDLIRNMFQATGTDEIPTYFILLDNDITNAELNYKIHQEGSSKYLNTQEGIREHNMFNPSLARDKMMRMTIPFAMTHRSMTIAETLLRRKGSHSTFVLEL